MSVIMRDAGPDAGSGSQNLARAMQGGLEMRRFAAVKAQAPVAEPTVATLPALPALPRPDLPRLRPALEPYANTLGHPAAARPGFVGRFVRRLRQGFKALLRPWLEIQTRFNEAAVAGLESTHSTLQAHLHLLGERLDAQAEILAGFHRSLNHCHETLHSQRNALEAKIEDCFDCLHASWQILDNRLDKFHESWTGENDAAGDLEQLFLRTRLPAPPARVLDLSRSAEQPAVDLSDLGYQVVRVDPRLDFLTRQEASLLPFEDGSFDVILCTSGLSAMVDQSVHARRLGSEANRLLCNHGQLLITGALRSSFASVNWNGLEEALHPLRVLERLHAFRQGRTWSFATLDVAQNHEGVVALVVAEKP